MKFEHSSIRVERIVKYSIVFARDRNVAILIDSPELLTNFFFFLRIIFKSAENKTNENRTNYQCNSTPLARRKPEHFLHNSSGRFSKTIIFWEEAKSKLVRTQNNDRPGIGLVQNIITVQ